MLENVVFANCVAVFVFFVEYWFFKLIIIAVSAEQKRQHILLVLGKNCTKKLLYAKSGDPLTTAMC